jgi:hypothetical protein
MLIRYRLVRAALSNGLCADDERLGGRQHRVTCGMPREPRWHFLDIADVATGLGSDPAGMA